MERQNLRNVRACERRFARDHKTASASPKGVGMGAGAWSGVTDNFRHADFRVNAGGLVGLPRVGTSMTDGVQGEGEVARGRKRRDPLATTWEGEGKQRRSLRVHT